MVQPDGLAPGRRDGRRLEHRQPLHHLLHLRQYLVHRPGPADHGAPVPGGGLLHGQEVRGRGRRESVISDIIVLLLCEARAVTISGVTGLQSTQLQSAQSYYLHLQEEELGDNL